MELTKTKVWYSIQNGGDGSAYPRWYTSSDDAEIDQERMDEGWGESCTGSVETFEGSDIHQEAIQNSEDLADELAEEAEEDRVWFEVEKDYYETRTVKSGRKTKHCVVCGGTIAVGQPAESHHFYPEFNSVDTHPECSAQFHKNLK